MWKFITAIPLLLHGLAHLTGFMAAFTSGEYGFTNQPWIFSKNIQLKSPVGKIFGLLWLVAMLGLVGSAIGLALSQEWWPTLAIVSAVISLVVIIPWWKTIPPGARAGAIFDIVILTVLLTPIKSRLLELIS